MKIAILTSKNQWFVPYAEQLANELPDADLFFDHAKIDSGYNTVFMLAYHQIVPDHFLQRHKHNIVIHESDLPHGKGWAPLFWQVVEGENEIVFSMFEAGCGMDDGDIYMQRTLYLDGYELHDELRRKQADLTLEMVKVFIRHYPKYAKPTPQHGEESVYPKRSPEDSQLDINKTLKEQFNLLRTVNNEEYPAFFEIDGHRYILKIEKDTKTYDAR